MATSGSILDESDTPDLTITNVTLTPSSPEVGQTVMVNVSVKNLGGSLTSGQGIDNWFSSIEDFTWATTSSVHLLGARQVASTTPMIQNETIIYSGTGVFTSNGTKAMSFTVDNANELPELSETNNGWTGIVTVGINSTYQGDGTYDFSTGQTVRLNNGLIIEPIIFSSGETEQNTFSNVKFKVYDSSGQLVGTVPSEPSIKTHVGQGLQEYRISGHTFYAEYHSQGLTARITLKSELGFDYDFNLNYLNTNPANLVFTPGANISLTGTFVYTGEDIFPGVVNVKWYIDNQLFDSYDLDYTPSYSSHLESGQSRNIVNDKWNNVPAGTYQVKLKIDANNQYTETNEGNNELTYTVKVGNGGVIELLPDFRIDYILNRYNNVDVALPSEIALGDTLLMEAIVANLGTGTPIPTTTDMFVYANDVFIGNSPVWRMMPGGTGSNGGPGISPTFLTWKPTALGTYTLRFVMDPNNVVPELNENNNTYEVAVKVSVKGADDSGKFAICHYNQGSKQYVEIRVDESGWINGHSKHEHDKKKVGASCGTVTADDNNDSSNDSELVKKLKERIRQLEYKVSQFEQAVVEREKQLIVKINKALAERLQGRILLQVESNGEAWYVDTDSDQRYYLQNGDSAYQALQAFGLGIKDTDLEKIPIGLRDDPAATDTDGDGLPDKLEISIGTDPTKTDSDGDGYNDKEEVMNSYSPLGPQKMVADNSLVNRLRGKILLQVEKNGQAWWINPADDKRYYLKDGESAYDIMRYLSLGISDKDLREIDVGDLN